MYQLSQVEELRLPLPLVKVGSRNRMACLIASPDRVGPCVVGNSQKIIY